MASQETTHFGFRDISFAEKAPLVRSVFSSVAARYDLMNDLMSGGLHRIWKAAMIDWLAPRKGSTLLDVAGGTGDIAFRYIDRAPDARAVLLDLTEEMLREGRDRARNRADHAQFEWVVGDAMALPFPKNSFDVYTISFGIRNVADPDLALREARRVLRPGGRLMILEFGHVAPELLSWAYDRYSFNIVPKIGEIIASDRESYQYLVESIRRFASQEELSHMISEAGFECVSMREMNFGIAVLHSGWVL